MSQGGLPVNYIKNNKGNLNSFTQFLKGLVRELSLVNYNWEENDYSIIQQLNCISFLGKSFKNENIYDVAIKIAHAIIMDNTELLPYDDTDASLHELTNSLKNEYQRSKREYRPRPLALHWKVCIENERGSLYVNMEVAREISSKSIPDINVITCCSFDVFVAGVFVGKYIQKSINRDNDGNIIDAIYTRITTGLNKDILWKGESVVEVKLRCDNEERIFLTVSGSYPPNFEYPQVFQLLDDNVYIKAKTSNAEKNIAIFTPQWKCENTRSVQINEHKLNYIEFSSSLTVKNEENDEELTLTNDFTSYRTEFIGNYIAWVEKSNYKLLSKVPVIKVYDKDRNVVYDVKKKYRIRSKAKDKWYILNNNSKLELGLIDIRVEYPDGHNYVETFYYIGDLSFRSINEQALSTEINCTCDSALRVEIENIPEVEVTNIVLNRWKISRSGSSMIYHSMCDFRIYNECNPTLRVSIAIPFRGVIISDVDGNIIPDHKIISYFNLANFCVISHGINGTAKVFYNSNNLTEEGIEVKCLSRRIISGIVPLSDYIDLIERMFNLYGSNAFDRCSSVVLTIGSHQIYIRKFVLDSTFYDGKIFITDKTEDNTEQFRYKDSIYAFPVTEGVDIDDFRCIELNRPDNIENVFTIPEEYSYNEIIIISGPEARRRIVPKYYNINDIDFDIDIRRSHAKQVTIEWSKKLYEEDVMSGMHWRIACKAFEICSSYNLPFSTHNALKAIARNSKLLVKFVLAIWMNDLKDVFRQDIERFEQEMVTALHWIPVEIWLECYNELLDVCPADLQKFIESKMGDFRNFLLDIFCSTLSTNAAEQFVGFVLSNNLAKGIPFNHSDINYYRQRIIGVADGNNDLPSIIHRLANKYYPSENMRDYQKTMIDSGICAAENACKLEDCNKIFTQEAMEYARIINFYRRYFKDTYSDIFIRTIKIINSKL